MGGGVAAEDFYILNGNHVMRTGIYKGDFSRLQANLYSLLAPFFLGIPLLFSYVDGVSLASFVLHP